MTAVELSRPAVTDLDLAVAGAMAVADHEMVGESILHVTDAEVVDVKDAGIPLAGAAVVHDDVFPASPAHRRMVDGGAGGGVQVAVGAVGTAAKEPSEETWGSRGGGSRSRGRLHSLLGLDP